MSAVLNELEVSPVVIPYFKEREHLPADILGRIYRRLVAEDLHRLLLHNTPDLSEEQFVQFAGEEALTSLFLDQRSGRFAGLAWLTNWEECETITKAIGSFCFFKDFWKNDITEAFGTIFLSQCFNVLQLGLMYGITPAPNRTAIRYCKRLGFEYLESPIPNFVSFYGRTVDAMVCTMTRERFNERIQAKEMNAG